MNFTPNDLNESATLRIRVIGIGGAGCHLVDHAAQAGIAGVEFLVANTDQRSLRAISISNKLRLGAKLTGGLGTGSDAELGRMAAEAEPDAIRQSSADADLIILCAGLGRGTGTGAAPVFARLAKESGALVLGLVTLPFNCEGPGRVDLARRGLQRLKGEADAVICLANESVARLFPDQSDLSESFQLTDRLFEQALRGLIEMLTVPGIIPMDFADVAAIFRNKHAEGAFASSEGLGPDRLATALAGLVQHPLLDHGQALRDASAILLNIVAGPTLPRDEIQRVVQELSAYAPAARISVHAQVRADLADEMRLTAVVSRTGSHLPEIPEPAPRGETPSAPALPPPSYTSLSNQLLDPGTSEKSASRFVPPAPDYNQKQKEALLARQKGRPHSGKRRPLWAQTTLPLDVISKGRFEKTQPTLHEGQDLDVPAYIRRGVALN